MRPFWHRSKIGSRTSSPSRRPARRSSKAEPDPAEARKLKARIKELKADAKELKDEIGDKTDRGAAIRRRIEDWRNDEPLTWGDWLAQQLLYDQISSLDHRRPAPKTIADFVAQESLYAPDINDGVRVNIAPLEKADLLAAEVLASKDLEKAIADRAAWRADERRWVREGKLPQPGWWPENRDESRGSRGERTVGQAASATEDLT